MLRLKSCAIGKIKPFVIFAKSLSTSRGDVILEKINHVGCITINRPKELNAFNLTILKNIRSKISEWNADDSVIMVLIRGAGNTAFCAGADIKSIRDHFIKGNQRAALEIFRNGYSLVNEYSSLKKPFIAIINGITMGSGVGASVHGKYSIATEKTQWAMPEATIGFFPDVGTVSRLSRLNGKLGLYLGLTGHVLKSKEVYDAGLATHFTNSKHIDELTQSFFQIKTEKDIEDIMTSLSTKTIKGKLDLDQINRTFNANSIEDIFQNLKKENTDWSKRQLKILSKMSPTSLKVTFKYITSASNYTLNDILQTDYNLCKKFIRDNDFFEGVRALLIDRGTLPMWNPPTIEMVKTETIDAYFQVPNDGDPLF